MGNQTTYSLSELLNDLGEKDTSDFLSTFSNKRNSDVESFLHHQAIRFEKADRSRTYLILHNGEILAYYTLTFKDMQVDCSKTLLKKLTSGLSNSHKVSTFLIGQIAKNDNVSTGEICLGEILIDIFHLIKKVHMLIGGRVVTLECENNTKLISLYEKHGFQLVNVRENNSELKTLFLIPDFEK